MADENRPAWEQRSQTDVGPEGEVFVISPTGQRGTIPRASLDKALARGFKLETAEQTTDAKLEQEYGDSAGQAFLEGAARGITLGLSDATIGQLDEEGFRERRKRNAGAALGGEVVGSLLPVGAGGLAMGAGRAAKAGVAARAGEGLGARVLGGAAAGAAEGAVFGAGTGISDIALSAEPLTAERVISTFGSSVLYGAGFGGAAGGAGALLSEGAKAGSKVVAKRLEAAGGKAEGVADDLAGMGRKELKAAREAEIQAIKANAREEAKAVIEDVRAFSAETRNAFVGADDAAIGARLGGTKKRIMKSVDDPRGWIEEPFQARNTARQLRVQEQALTEAIDAGTLSEGGLAKANEWLAANRQAQARIKSFTDALTTPQSPRLSQIDDAIETFGDRAAANKPGVITQALGTTAGTMVGGKLMAMGLPAPLAFMAGGKVSEMATDLIMRKLGNRLGEAAAKAGDATIAGVERFLGKATGAIERAAPVVASKVLGQVQFATPEAVKASPPARPYAPTKDGKVSTFRERESELRAVTEPGPDGKPRMRIAAAKDLASRLSGVAAVSPQLAAQLEKVATRRLEFLADKLPKRPGPPEAPIGPDTWRPSDMQIATFARFVDAVENVRGVVQRMADGTMTPEDAEALKTVYPEEYNEIRVAIMERLPTLQKSLPYQKRLMLSIFFDAPVDPAMQPEVIGALQGNYAAEPGTEGGTQPAPSRFASLRGNNAPKPTPAQDRAG